MEFGVFITRSLVAFGHHLFGNAWEEIKSAGSTRGLRINYLLCLYLCTACAIKSIWPLGQLPPIH